MGAITGVQTKTSDNTSATSKTTLNSIGGAATEVPIGCIFPFVGSEIPSDMLLCDGSAVSRTTYADLFAVIGVLYGAGNGTTTFNLPNFITGNRIPIGKDAATTQIQQVGNSGGALSHNHVGGSHQHSFTHTHTAPGHSHTYNHTHTLGNHTHTIDHSHTIGHTHSIPAHGHQSITVHSYTVDDHQHDMYGTATLNNDAMGKMTDRYTYTRTSETTNSVTSTISLGSSLGSGTDMSLYAVTSGGASPISTTGTYGATCYGPSANTTGTYNGTTTSNSTSFNLESYTGYTGMGGSDVNTTDSTIPYLTVHYIIKAILNENSILFQI